MGSRLTPPAAFFWSTANLMPFAVDWPPVVHTGRSDPILMVPLDAVPPPPPPPHATATTAANVRITSPLPRTIWFSLCLLEAAARCARRCPQSFAALFPTAVGARVRRQANAATRGGRTTTPW